MQAQAPTSPATADEPPLDLDERIRQAEQELIARDERVLQRVHALGERVRRMRDPRHWALPLAGGVAAAVVALGLWRLTGPRRRHAADVDRERPPVRRAHAAGGVAGALLGLAGGSRLLMQWLPMVWPLLPERVRAHGSPTSTAALLGIGWKLARDLTGPRGAGELRTAPFVDLRRYAGTWHEVARLPEPHEDECRDQPRATYTPRGQVIEVLNRCRGADGEVRTARGIARVQPGSGGAKLEVTFAPAWLHWLPMVWADYWILYVDGDYSVALVGNPKRDRLWLLARQPSLEPAALRAVVDIARVQGFPVQHLLPSVAH